MLLEKAKLKSTLNKVSVFVYKDAGVGSKILFSAKEGKASITASDGPNIGIFSFPIPEGDELEFVADYKALSSAASLRGDVQAEFKDEVLTISQGDTVMVFPASDKSSFSFEERNVENGTSIQINSSVLKRLIGKVSYARKEKDIRPFVTGVHLKLENGILTTESTDAIRMLRDSVTLEPPVDVTFSGVLNSKTIRAIETMDEDKVITLVMNENAIGFISDDMKVYMPILNCEYPNTEKLFEVDAKATFVLNKVKVVESMEILALTENKALKCKKSGNQILFAKEDGVSDVKDRVDLESSDGEGFEFCVDFDYFRDIFRHLKEGSNNVTFYFQEPLKILKFKDEENFEGVMMPLRK